MTTTNPLAQLPSGTIVRASLPISSVIYELRSEPTLGRMWWTRGYFFTDDDLFVAYGRNPGGFEVLIPASKTIDRGELLEIYDEARRGLDRPGYTEPILDELMSALFDLLDLDPTPATQAEVTSVETIINGGEPL